MKILFYTFLLSIMVSPARSTKRSSNPVQWIVRELPKGKFQAKRHLKLVPLNSCNIEDLKDDELIVQPEAFSVDAFLRTLLEAKGFHGSFSQGSPMRALGYGIVIESKSKKHKVGSRVIGMMPVASTTVVKAKEVSSNPIGEALRLPPKLSLGLLGVSGFSAYAGIFLATPKAPQKGETVVISAAAGGVGNIAAQMAKRTGARVVGIAGGAEKTDFLINKLRLDAAVDYKDISKPISDQLKEACPEGIDFYFDNVGGETLDAVLENINNNARISLCGAISQYDTGKLYSAPYGPKNYLKLSERNASMSGFVVTYFLQKPRHLLSMMIYILWNYFWGRLKVFEHTEIGIESFGESMEKMLKGEHTGRLIVQI